MKMRSRLSTRIFRLIFTPTSPRRQAERINRSSASLSRRAVRDDE
jgi:hypothetical protein